MVQDNFRTPSKVVLNQTINYMERCVITLFLPLILISCGPSYWYESGENFLYGMQCMGVLNYTVNPYNALDSVLCVKTELRGPKKENHVYYLKTGNIVRIDNGEEHSEFVSLVDSNGEISKTTINIYDNGYSHLYLTIFLDSAEYNRNIKITQDTTQVYLGEKVICIGNFIKDTLIVDDILPFISYDYY